MKRCWLILLGLMVSGCLAPDLPQPSSTPIPTNTAVPTATVVWFPPTNTPAVTPTRAVTPTPGVMAELGEVIFRDDLNSAEDWIVPSSDRGRVNIGDGEINVIINEPGSYFTAVLEKPDLGNFYVEITANPILCSPEDEYGFLFRVRSQQEYYRFSLTCGGEVRLDRLYGGGSAVLYPWTRSASVPVGAPSVSKLAVLVVNDQIYLYINGDPQYTADSQEVSVGSFGVYARSVSENAVTISFSDLVVREVLPK